MTDRILLDENRLVISKPGRSATNPNLADEYKIIDSNWLFGSSIIASGFHEFRHRTGGTWTITFPPQNYIPSALLYFALPPWSFDIDISGSYMIQNDFRNVSTKRQDGEFLNRYRPVRMYRNRIEIPQPPSGYSQRQNYVHADDTGGPRYIGIVAVIFGI